MRVDVLVYSLMPGSRSLENRVRKEYKDFKIEADSFVQAEEFACEKWHKDNGINWQCITRIWQNMLIELTVMEITNDQP